MVRSWTARIAVVLFASTTALGCGHHRQQRCCCPCQCAAPAAAEKSAKPATDAVAPKQEAIPQLVPPAKPSKPN
jgi:hypothetical protein